MHSMGTGICGWEPLVAPSRCAPWIALTAPLGPPPPAAPPAAAAPALEATAAVAAAVAAPAMVPWDFVISAPSALDAAFDTAAEEQSTRSGR